MKQAVGGNKEDLYLYIWDEIGLCSDEISSLTKKSIDCTTPITETLEFWNVSHFGTLEVSQPVKVAKQKQLEHDLLSSKSHNTCDFFADL